MAWFVVKEVENGSVFGYSIRKHLVEVEDAEHLAELRREPDRFLEVADKKVAAKMAATFTSETGEMPVDTDEEKDEEKEGVDEIVDEEEPEEKPKKKLKKKKK